MATHQQRSPNTGMHQHHAIPPGHIQPNGHGPMQAQGAPKSTQQYLTARNEEIWLHMGSSPVDTVVSHGGSANRLQVISPRP
jgi:general transcriptional corepressor CYC8